MYRNLPTSPGDGSDGSAPSEAWLFAQAILGKPIPRIVSPEAKARAEHEELERLAQFSSRHASELHRLQAAEAEARHDREVLEWAAQISTDAAAKLRALERKEAEEREAWRRAERFVESLLEDSWDSSQHPRAPKGQSDGGQWVAKGGGAGDADITAAGTPITKASHSGPNQVAAQLVSWPPPTGHHWVPIGAVQHSDIRPYLSDEAVQYAAGAYSGPTNPSHRNATYGEVKHPKYTAEVKKELKAFIEERKIKKMTAHQMEEFVELIKSGRGASGQPNPLISSFNTAIKSTVAKGSEAPSKMEDILAAGRRHMKHSRFQVLAAGAVISGILGEVIDQQIKLLDVASQSGLYRQALSALQNGDLNKARNLLIGDRDSLYHEILTQVGAHAALNFKAAMERVFTSARNREYE